MKPNNASHFTKLTCCTTAINHMHKTAAMLFRLRDKLDARLDTGLHCYLYFCPSFLST